MKGIRVNDLLKAVSGRLGLPPTPDLTLDGLAEVYRAWCRQVPFDNLRKLVALYRGQSGPLPGIEAEDFFQAWLEHGAGGTCWASSNALFTLLQARGLPARRVVGSMLDQGMVNHGSVMVTARDEEWLVDSSMLSNQVLPMRPYLSHQPPPFIEVESLEGSVRVWVEFLPHPQPIPCRIQPEAVDLDQYRLRYEASRRSGPFNERIYARRNLPEGMQVVIGCRRYRKTEGLVEISDPLSSDALRRCLVEEMGYSHQLCDELEACGAWSRSLEAEAGPPPSLSGVELPPSLR